MSLHIALSCGNCLIQQRRSTCLWALPLASMLLLLPDAADEAQVVLFSPSRFPV